MPRARERRCRCRSCPTACSRRWVEAGRWSAWSGRRRRDAVARRRVHRNARSGRPRGLVAGRARLARGRGDVAVRWPFEWPLDESTTSCSSVSSLSRASTRCPSSETFGRIRSSQPGSHQALSPSSVTTAGSDHQAHDQDVDQDREAEAEAHHLADHVGLGDEGQEHRRHDQAGEQDHLADPRHAVDHALARPVALVVGLVHRARAGRRCSPCSGRTGSRTSSPGRTRRSARRSPTPTRPAPMPFWKTATTTP